jgi:hypothetical protein
MTLEWASVITMAFFIFFLSLVSRAKGLGFAGGAH